MSTRYLDRTEGRIAYDDSGGTGAVVIAVPGMGDVRAEYRFLAPFLQRAGYRVVTLDVRGHGESSVDWRDYSAHAVAGDVLSLMDELDIASAAVLGTSFAAGAAVWCAHDAPQRVDALVLIGPVLRDLPQPWYVKAAMAVGFGGPWRVGFWLAYWNTLFPTAKPPDHDQYRKALRRNLGERGRMHALETMVGLSKRDTEAILDAVRAPTLIVMGSKDPDFGDPAAEARLVADRLGASIEIIDGAGHYPQAEMPDRVGPKIVAFFGSLRQP